MEALLVVDLHAHLLQSEVAGLLGGYLKHSSESSSLEENCNVLKVCRAIPCQSSSSNVGCDICPVSQTEALEALEAEGLELVGWYHSHPTFPPLPSVQDIETQIRVQDWFTRSNGSPFIGLILSPHSSVNLSLASSYRCILIDDKQEIKKVPFELDASLRSLETSGPCLSYLKNVITIVSKDSSAKINLDDSLESIHIQCITLRKKIIESARILLESGKPQPQYSVKVDIITGLEKILTELTNLSSEDNVESH
ncbi:hypothetical protein J437_LFUL001928 [Ladona fulva]|uniref:MPN domain-containing protein n=1 Tax=Ladona fulva TaxID=123851 RepID=A0A8K0K3H9_LADFU|nr:hypothetical protein J437_LFUL001928 [Ladona fulva]